MSKKVILYSLLALLVVAALVLTNFGRNLPFIGPRIPEYTAEIPETRPERLDQHLLERFEGQSMADILAVLAAEKAAKETMPEPENPEPPEDETATRLLRSLPDAAFPFEPGDTPGDTEWLKEYVTSMKREENSAPSP